MSDRYVTVLTALSSCEGKVVEQKVYAYAPDGCSSPAADKEFERLKQVYGAANVCMSSRTIIHTIEQGHGDVSMGCKIDYTKCSLCEKP